jgi:hypothetical protein
MLTKYQDVYLILKKTNRNKLWRLIKINQVFKNKIKTRNNLIT